MENYKETMESAKTLFAAHKYQEMLNILLPIEEEGQTDPYWHLLLGMGYANSGIENKSKAIAALDSVLKLAKGNAELTTVAKMQKKLINQKNYYKENEAADADTYLDNKIKKKGNKLMEAVKKEDVAAVKQLVESGERLDQVIKLHNGDSTTPYLYAVMWSVDEGKVSQKLLEIVEYLSPRISGHYFRDLEGSDYNGHTFYTSYFGRLMSVANTIGEYDVVIEAMLRGGYKFGEDPNLGRYIGKVGFPLAKRLLEQFGTDDGTSVHSAVESRNNELVAYLLDKGVSPNQPFWYSTGDNKMPLVTAIRCSNIEAVKMLLDAGADPKAKDTGCNKDAFEMAKSAGNQQIIDILI